MIIPKWTKLYWIDLSVDEPVRLRVAEVTRSGPVQAHVNSSYSTPDGRLFRTVTTYDLGRHIFQTEAEALRAGQQELRRRIKRYAQLQQDAKQQLAEVNALLDAAESE